MIFILSSFNNFIIIFCCDILIKNCNHFELFLFIRVFLFYAHHFLIIILVIFEYFIHVETKINFKDPF